MAYGLEAGVSTWVGAYACLALVYAALLGLLGWKTPLWLVLLGALLWPVSLVYILSVEKNGQDRRS